MNSQIKVDKKDAEELWEFLQQHNINGTWKDKTSFFRKFEKYPYWNWKEVELIELEVKKNIIL